MLCKLKTVDGKQQENNALSENRIKQGILGIEIIKKKMVFDGFQNHMGLNVWRKSKIFA